MTAELGVDVTVIRELGEAARDTNIWVTCTPARRWFLGRAHVAAGAFVAAVGADNPEKQEIEPELLAAQRGRGGRARAVRDDRRPASRDRRRPHASRGRSRRAGRRRVRAEAGPALPGRDRDVRQHGHGPAGCGGRRAGLRARALERRRPHRRPGPAGRMADDRSRLPGRRDPVEWLDHEAAASRG